MTHSEAQQYAVDIVGGVCVYGACFYTFFLFLYSSKKIYNDAHILLYLSKTNRQHHMGQYQRVRKSKAYPKAKTIKTHSIKLKLHDTLLDSVAH